jgi:hypothetical protein
VATLLLLALASIGGGAAAVASEGAQALKQLLTGRPEFLPVDQAFRFSAEVAVADGIGRTGPRRPRHPPGRRLPR